MRRPLRNCPWKKVDHAVEDRTCPDCGAEMGTVGKEFVRDELVYVSTRLFVRKHHVETAPEPMIPHSFCFPELLVHIHYVKYAKVVPLTVWRRISPLSQPQTD